MEQATKAAAGMEIRLQQMSRNMQNEGKCEMECETQSREIQIEQVEIKEIHITREEE